MQKPVASLSLNTNSINPFIAKLDSGASKHYIKTNHQNNLCHLQPLNNGPIAILPDATTVQASHKGTCPLHDNLSTTAKEALVFPHLTNESLISVGQLCDDDCEVIFNKTKVNVSKNKKVILQGTRNKNDGLWDINVNQNTLQHKMNFVITKDKSKLELAQYLHAAAFSPAISTFQKAIQNGNFIGWPGIDEINFSKVIKTTKATELGHLDQERKHLQGTKDEVPDFFPNKISSKVNEVYSTIISSNMIKNQNKSYCDLTGRFPHKSTRGNQYLFVLYDYDSNAILFEPLKTRQAHEITKAFNKIYTKLTQHTSEPRLYILDNECSNDLKLSILKNKGTYQLVPPHQHRQNAAEKAIRTLKNHLLSGIATCDPTYPIEEWDRLLPQCELTLNLLRTSRINSKLSAWAYLFGTYNFNRCPVAPPGTKILVHSKPSKRASWEFHGVEGWYVGPSLQHYRCVRCYIPKTRSEIISDTIKFIPNHIPIPEPSLEDVLTNTLQDLTNVLNTNATTLPALQNNTAKQAIISIANALNTKPSVRTSEGATINPIPTLKNNKTKKVTKPLTDEEFQRILDNIPKAKINKPNNSQPPKIFGHPSPGLDYTIPTPKKVPPIQLPTHSSTSRKLGRPRVTQPTYTKPTINQKLGYLQAQQIVQTLNHIFQDGKRQTLDMLLKGPMKNIWNNSTSRELGRLSNGWRNEKGNEALEFIPISEVPKGEPVTYANMVCDIRHHKEDKYRVRLTVGGDRLEYFFETAAPAASLLEAKLIINSTISQSAKNARFMTLDIKDFFLQSTMKQPQYMKIHSKYFSDEFRSLYNINNIIAPDGFVSLNTSVDTKRPPHVLILVCFCLSIKKVIQFNFLKDKK